MGGMGEMGGAWRERGLRSTVEQPGLEPEEVWSHSAVFQPLLFLFFLSYLRIAENQKTHWRHNGAILQSSAKVLNSLF